MKKTKLFSFIKWYMLILAFQVTSAILVSFFFQPWYSKLIKSSWTPPDWVFAPVWTILYFLMAVSIFTLSQFKASNQEKRFAYTIFFTQLVLNVGWTFLFFYMHRPLWALVELGFLLFFIGLTIYLFCKIRLLSGLLLFPYFFWTLYAFVLNFSIVILN